MVGCFASGFVGRAVFFGAGAWVMTDKDTPVVADPYNATLVQRVDVAPRLAIFRVKPDSPFDFKAGQFVVLGLTRASQRLAGADPGFPEESGEPGEADATKAGRLIRRAYSVASGSQTREFVEFYIALVGSGQLTPRLFNLKIGDRLFMGNKASGVFTLDQVPADSNLLLVGTGTGLAPYMSMVRTLALGDGCLTRSMAVLHGARYSWDLGYRSDLEFLGHSCTRFKYVPIVSSFQIDTSWNGLIGRLDRLINLRDLDERIGFDCDPRSCHVFLCGNPAMVVGLTAILKERGFDPGTRKEPGNLHMESYW